MGIINIISSVLTPIIAITTVYIAIQQYITNSKKLKLDLYQKRYNCYRIIKEYLKKIRVIKGENILDELFIFESEISESEFLFSKNIKNFITEIISDSVQLAKDFENMQSIDIDESIRNSSIQRKKEILINFNNKLTNLGKTFIDYLDFRKI